MGKGIGIAVSVIILVAALVVCLVPLKTVAYTVTVDYEDTETYYVDEPYEDVETYTETVPVEMEILEHHLERDFLLFVRGKVKNTGDVTLASIDVTIWVEYQVEGLEDRVFRQPGSIGLSPATFKPGEVRDFSVLVQDGTMKYKILAPTTTKTVEKQRTITKYKQVEKQRTVTNQRPETRYKEVTLLDYFLHY